MMKIVFFSFIFLCFAGRMQAQSLLDLSKPDKEFTLGVLGGLNSSYMDNSDASGIRTGFHIGAKVDYNIVKSFSITSGILYSEKGFYSDRGKANLSYLHIPLCVSYRIETPTGIKFNFNLGQYFAYGLGGRLNLYPQLLNYFYSFDQDSFGEKGFFKHFDMGMTAGAYIQISHVILGVSYEYGLIDIAKVYGKFHNRNVATTIGVNF